MLSESDKELLSAFVDGELTHRQRKAVLSLLHQSSEARGFLRELQENAHRFKLLPHRKLEESFADRVLGEIAARGLKPYPPVSAPLRRRWPLWTASAAAAIFLAVGLWYGNSRSTPDHIDGAGEVARAIVPELRPRKMVIPFKDFALAEHKDALRKELERETSVHLDLGVRHGTRAVERFVQVLKDNKFDPVISPVAVASIKKNQAKTQYVVYAEGVRPEEVLSMLQQLGNDARGKSQGGFETVVLTSLDSQDRQKLADLGLNVQQGSSDRKPEETPRPKDKAPTLRTPERLAVVLTNDVDGGAGFAPEVQAFLERRRELNPGTMQVLVVLTPATA